MIAGKARTYAGLEALASATAMWPFGTNSAVHLLRSREGRADISKMIISIQMAAHALNPSMESPNAKLDKLVAYLDDNLPFKD